MKETYAEVSAIDVFATSPALREKSFLSELIHFDPRPHQNAKNEQA